MLVGWALNSKMYISCPPVEIRRGKTDLYRALAEITILQGNFIKDNKVIRLLLPWKVIIKGELKVIFNVI